MKTYTAIAVCDRKGQHEVRLVTNGELAYAYGLGQGATDCGPISGWHGADRVYTKYEVPCEQPVAPYEGERCDGEVMFLVRDDEWTEDDAEAQQAVRDYGSPVES